MKPTLLLRKIIAPILLIVFISIGIVTTISPTTYADDACEIANIDDPRLCGNRNENEESNLQQHVRSALNTVYIWIGIITVVAIVIGGISYMTSAGSAEKAKNAKNTIMYSLIGLIVTLMAFAITNLILNSIEGDQPTTGQASGGSQGGGSGGSAENQTVPVKIVVLNGVSTLKVYQNENLRATIIPDYATNRQLTWSTSDKNIVDVDDHGRIIALSPGTATITATADGKSDSKTITVPQPIEPKSISFDSNKITIAPKQSKSLIPHFLPTNVDDKTLNWKSSDPTIATVNENGKVVGIKEGITTVTATATNGIFAQVTVNVSTYTGSTGDYCVAETGRGLCKATKITFKHHVNDSKGRCGTIKGSYCTTLATVTYPKGTIEYYIGFQNNPGLNKGSCRAHAFTAALNATSGTTYSTIDIQNHLKSKGLYKGTLRARNGYAEVIKHFKAKAKAYFGEISVKESKRLAKIALDNGQPVAMFVAHNQCPNLAGSHHALLLLGYDSNNKVQFIDSSGYSISQSGKYTIDKLFDTCMSSKGVRESWMGMQIFEF